MLDQAEMWFVQEGNDPVKASQELGAERTFKLAIQEESYETVGCVIKPYDTPEARRRAIAAFDKALGEVEKIIRIVPESTRALNDMVSCLIKLGRTPDAMKCQETYDNLQSSNSGYWYLRGNALSVHGSYEKAIPFLDKAIRLDSEYTNAWYSKAQCLAGMSRHKEAIRCYSRALKLSAKSSVM